MIDTAGSGADSPLLDAGATAPISGHAVVVLRAHDEPVRQRRPLRRRVAHRRLEQRHLCVQPVTDQAGTGSGRPDERASLRYRCWSRPVGGARPRIEEASAVSSAGEWGTGCACRTVPSALSLRRAWRPRRPAPRHRLTTPVSRTRLRTSPGRSWSYAFKQAWAEFRRDECTDLAAGLTYYAVLSLFPALLAMISLLGVFGQGESTTDTLLELVERIGQEDAVDQLREPITQMTETNAAGFALVFGLLGALWSASGYVGAFGRAMNKIYEVDEGRPFWKLRPFNLAITVVTVLLAALVLLGLVVSGPSLRSWERPSASATRRSPSGTSSSGRSCCSSSSSWSLSCTTRPRTSSSPSSAGSAWAPA